MGVPIVDRAVKPVAGHGAGLRPGLVSSVEPIGIVPTPSREVAGIEVLDCKDVALPTEEACPHVVVDAGAVVVDIGPVAVVPSCVVSVEIPTPPASNNAVEFDVPVIAFPMPGKPVDEHAVVEVSP